MGTVRQHRGECITWRVKCRLKVLQQSRYLFTPLSTTKT